MHQVDASRVLRPVLRVRMGWLVLVAVVLTGVPQALLAWSDGSVYETRASFRTVRRALLLDKALTGRTVVPQVPAAPASTKPPASLRVTVAAVPAPLRVVREAPPRPRAWLLALVRVLYRHGSNYT